jgi:uncharacterized protein
LSHPVDRLYVLGVASVVVLMLTGLGLLWRLVLSPAARSRRVPAALTAWPGTGSDLLLFFLLAVCGAIVLPNLAVAGLRHTTWDSETRLVLAFAAFQLGMLVGIAAFYLFWARDRVRPEPSAMAALGSGVVTVLIALPLVQASALAWQALLTLCGLPVETPDNVQIFLDLHSPLLRVLYVLLATVIAPVTEEFLFRAGLFRYCRGRLPRWLALLLPALIFGALHLTRAPLESLSSLGPLVVLGIILSLAYERTGRISTAIIAHALFNLTTVLLVLAGVNT